MNITSMTIRGENGQVEIARTDDGALVTTGDRVICEVRRDENDDARCAKAVEVAKVVYGTDRRGRAAATNSMVHEVLIEVERIAGC